MFNLWGKKKKEKSKKVSNTNFWGMTDSFSYHVEMSKEKEEPGCLLLEMSPPAPRQPVRAVHAEGPWRC